jgi:hypothetical protein
MPRSARATKDNPPLDDARVQHLLRRAAVAAVLFDPIGADALLDLPAAEVGRLFKICLARVIGRATVLNLDLRALREEEETLSVHSKRGSKRRRSARHSLVAEGKLLRAAIVCQALGITERRLAKDVVSRRFFVVEIGGDCYYPAFFLVNELDRRQLAKVVRRLDGLTGWAKWRFFTKPKASLAKLTPLQTLLHGEVNQVLQTADAFVERARELAKPKIIDTRN